MRKYMVGIMQQIRLIVSDIFLGWALAVLPKESAERFTLAQVINRYFKINVQPPSGSK